MLLKKRPHPSMVERLHIRQALIVLLIASIAVLSGCRAMEKDEPPIHPNLNMDFQERFDPQERNWFFADTRAMRPTVPGTVPRGFLREDRAFYYGAESAGAFVTTFPLPVTIDLVERGQERYDIFCAPCHGASGDGQGIITTGGYGYTPAPSFHTDRLRDMPVGEIYSIIVNGVRTMPPYASQVPVADRWAIVSYIRALQRSQNADLEDVPASMRSDLREMAAAAGEAAAAGDTTAAGAAPATTDTAAAAGAEAPATGPTSPGGPEQ